eukprot:2546998-Amphidinium_carterae.2
MRLLLVTVMRPQFQRTQQESIRTALPPQPSAPRRFYLAGLNDGHTRRRPLLSILGALALLETKWLRL